MEVRGGKETSLLARWTSNFDCEHETNWWYCIKDTRFDILALSSKKRYEINKEKKNFHVKEIDPVVYVERMIEIQEKAWRNYPKAYRRRADTEKMRNEIGNWRKYRVFGAFDIAGGVLAAYACLEEHTDWVNFVMLKAEPASEKFAVNAAIVAGICEYYNDRLSQNFYICDGERNVIHQTAFQDYLIKYFEFRKAYCELNISYKPPWGIAVKCIYPFRRILHRFNKTKIGSKVDAVLLMENIRRIDNIG